MNDYNDYIFSTFYIRYSISEKICSTHLIPPVEDQESIGKNSQNKLLIVFCDLTVNIDNLKELYEYARKYYDNVIFKPINFISTNYSSNNSELEYIKKCIKIRKECRDEIILIKPFELDLANKSIAVIDNFIPKSKCNEYDNILSLSHFSYQLYIFITLNDVYKKYYSFAEYKEYFEEIAILEKIIIENKSQILKIDISDAEILSELGGTRSRLHIKRRLIKNIYSPANLKM